jgi:flagellar motor switch protein FliN/FliY
MSEATRDPAQYLETWRDVLAQVLQEISGAPLPCSLSREAPADLTPPSESDLWIVVTALGAVRGEMSARCSAASTIRLAQIFMSQPAASATETTSEHRDAVLELLRQTAGLVATALKRTWGEVQLSLEASTGAPTWPASSTAWLQLGSDSATAPVIEIQLSAALVAALRAEAEKTAPPPAAVPAPSEAAEPASPSNPVNLDLLMDVELAVTLRFGQRRLLLREVLDLNPGAVVDLDRQVQEPVDMLLDGRIIARGEIVVLDGNYGLRVTEVAPAEVQ